MLVFVLEKTNEKNVPLSVGNCARCGKKHRPLMFKKFKRQTQSEPPSTHWAMCPTTKEPILMRFDVTI
jgi:hypothetical protein